MRILKIVFGALFLGAMLSGCASLSDSREELAFTSEPEGATAEMVGNQCTTPCVMEVDRGDKREVSFSMEGCQPVQYTVTSEYRPQWHAGASIFMGIFPYGVDLLTESYYDHEFNYIFAELDCS